MEETNIKYYFSKTVIILSSILMLLIAFSIAFITYLLFFVNIKIGGFISLAIFFLFLTTFPNFLRRLKYFFQNTPALLLTKEELIDNINLQKFKWTDIENISTNSARVDVKVNYISISLIAPEKYYSFINNPYDRLIARLNQKYFGGAFSIQPNIIKCDNNELLKTLRSCLEENKSRN